MSPSALLETIQHLPPEVRREVEDFIERAKKRQTHTHLPKLKLDWVGGMEDLKDQYTSRQLRKQALEWMNKP